MSQESLRHGILQCLVIKPCLPLVVPARRPSQEMSLVKSSLCQVWLGNEDENTGVYGVGL